MDPARHDLPGLEHHRRRRRRGNVSSSERTSSPTSTRPWKIWPRVARCEA